MIKKPLTNCVFDIDGMNYRIVDNRLEEIPDLAEIKEAFLYISDMQGSVSGVMTVEAPVKYAPMIVRKHVQESGEFDTPVIIVPHWRKKLEGNLTEVFYTAVPAAVYKSYVDQTQNHNKNVLLIPIYKALLIALKQLKSDKPSIVVFQHNRFADTIIGTRNKILSANRCVAFDNSPEQLETLWNLVNNEITAAEVHNKTVVSTILLYSWTRDIIDVNWPDDKHVVKAQSRTVLFNDTEIESSLLTLPDRLSTWDSISPVLDKAAYVASTKTALFNTVILLLIITACSLTYLRSTQTGKLNEEISHIENKIRAINHEAPSRFSYEQFSSVFTFLKTLHTCKKTLSYKQVINDMSESFSSDIILQDFSVSYADNGVEIKMISRINAPFETANMHYQSILSTLRAGNYDITASSFDTQINTSGFFLTAIKSHNE